MKFTEEQLRKADEEIRSLIDSGKYKQLDMSVIDNISEIKINDSTKKVLSNVMNIYFEYLENLKSLDENRMIEYLKLCKNADILDNQKLEKEDSLLISLYMRLQGEFAVDKILKYDNLDNIKIQEIHEILMKNTSSGNSINKGFRKHNRKYVGEIIDGNRVIQYFPIDYSNIEEAMNRILVYYNDNTKEKEISDIFIKPIIIHGLISAYQGFEDGNTRLARLLQHVKIFDITNKLTDYKLPLPSLYATRAYYPYRIQYRNLIKNIVLNNDSKSWNEWISFNLKRIEDRLYYSIDKIEKLDMYGNPKGAHIK